MHISQRTREIVVGSTAGVALLLGGSALAVALTDGHDGGDQGGGRALVQQQLDRSGGPQGYGDGQGYGGQQGYGQQGGQQGGPPMQSGTS